MTRRLILALALAAVVGFFASRISGSAAGVTAGILSFAGFIAGSMLLRSRLRARQGTPPGLEPGEEARLYGPCLVLEGASWKKAWAYLSNRAFKLRGEGDSFSMDLALSDIEEIRPRPKGLGLAVRGRGLIDMKFADAPRWIAALQLETRR